MPREPQPSDRNPRDRRSGRRRPEGAIPPRTFTALGDAHAEIPSRSLDQDALTVVHRLRSFGHQAYLVGGCVRDLLLGRQPKDFDVATSAHPGEIRATFRNCRLIGRRFRLAHVYFRGGKIVETATFRANPNGEAAAGDLLITRDNVFGTAEEDARRRDFTVNGLFYDVVLGKVLDYVGGKADLEKKLLRTIGDPDVRIQEDPVRLLRAVRFAAKMDFEIEERTWKALVDHKGELARCAPARVLEEIFRLLRSGHAERCLQILHRLDALEVLLPPLAAQLRGATEEDREAFFHSLRLLDGVVQRGILPDDSVLLASLLVHLAEGEEKRPEPSAAAEETTEEATEEATEETSEETAEEPAEEHAEVAAEPERFGEEAEVEEAEAPAVPWAVSASAASVEDLLRELSRSARLPRRISERASLLLRARKVFAGAKRRRGSPMRLVRQPHFPDALFVEWLRVQATGKGAEALDRWIARAEQAGIALPWRHPPSEPAPPAPARGEPAPPEPARVEPAPAPEPSEGRRKAAPKESLPPEAERRPPAGPADFLPF